jgi:putative ABC transport system permease protein
MANTGIPISFGTTVLLGIVVGIVVSGQYLLRLCVGEVWKNFAALKAMGLSDSKLTAMVLLQAFTIGGLGYGIGAGSASIFGYDAGAAGPPFQHPWQLHAICLGVIITICVIASLIALRRLRQLDPAAVFRS